MNINDINTIEIDEGIFKYILIKIKLNENNKIIVRGYDWAEYHGILIIYWIDEIFEKVYMSLEPLGIDCECIGGGRIEHNPNKKEIKIYGYSKAYGKADHNITKQLLENEYYDYNIEITDKPY